MSTFPYSKNDIPEPVIEVEISAVAGSKKIDKVMALIDSGADVTCVPPSIVQRLGLEHIRPGKIQGSSGTSPTKVYAINISFNNKKFNNLPVWELKEEDYLLIGRDILNNFRICLDGPKLTTEIS